MITKQRVITIDNGGSSIRVIKNSDSRDIAIIDKHISTLHAEQFRIKDGVDELDVIRVLDSPNHMYNTTYLTGRGYYMYPGIDVVINNQSKKSSSDAWYKQLIITIAMDAITAARRDLGNEFSTNSQHSTSGIEYEYTLATLIPVHEHSGAVDCVSTLKETLSGQYVVEFPVMQGVNKVKFTLSGKKIGVLPEGVVAMTAMKDIVKPTDHTLIIDMGHVTTELVICRGLNMLGASVMSSPFAGGTLLKLIGSSIRDSGVLSSTESEIEALINKVRYMGNKAVPMVDEVNKAKEMFVVNYIKDEILNQLELSGLSKNQINYIVPVGAVLGLLDENGEHDVLKRIMVECKLENAEVKILSKDLRLVNIEKAAEFADQFAKHV